MDPAEFSKQRLKFLAELERVYETARAIETILGIPSRIRPAPDATTPVRGIPLEGTTMRRIWDLLRERPGLDQQAIRTTLPLRKETVANSVHHMVKHGQLRTEGRRNTYRYFAVVR